MNLRGVLNRGRITDRVAQRFKGSLLIFGIVAASSIIGNVLAASYTYEGKTFDHYKLREFDRGYVEIYSNRDEVCTSWVLVPGTELIAYWVQALAYLAALFYLFLGIAIVVDILLSAVEVITSHTRRIKYEDDNGVEKYLEVAVWNPTIANITLMAICSSSPEILLTIIETIYTLDSAPGEVGPALIVGSAAFNFFIVTAVSMVAVPYGKTLKINNFGVFLITAFFSLFAYFWFFIVLDVWSEDKISIPEAVITFCLFFFLVILVYIADKISTWRDKKLQGKDTPIEGGEPEEAGRLFNIDDFYHILRLTKEEAKAKVPDETSRPEEEELDEDEKEEESKHSATNHRLKADKAAYVRRHQLEAYLKETFDVDDVRDINPEDVKRAIQPKSVVGRMKYRRVVGNQIAGRKPFVIIKGMKKQVELQLASTLKKAELNPYVGFKCLHYSVTEGAGTVEIRICKKTQDALEIGVRTADGTATAPDDYHTMDEVLVFQKHEHEKTIKVDIVDDNEWEPDEDFFIELYDVNTSQRLKGKDTQSKITIIDDDQPGQLGFHSAKLTCQSKNKFLMVKVVRKHGCDGIVKVKYQIRETEEKAKHRAIPYEHFIPRTDTLIFEHGETEKEVKVDIIEVEDEDPDRDDVFQIRLFDAEPEGAKITKKNKCAIHIVGDNELDHKVEDIEKILELMQKSNEVSWAGQFKRACLLHPQVDEEGNVDEVTGLEALLHFTSIGWKVLFACIPPARF